MRKNLLRVATLLFGLIFVVPIFAADTQVYNSDNNTVDVQALPVSASGRYYRLIKVYVTNYSESNRAEVILRHGTNSSAPRFMTKITLAAGESTERDVGQMGPRITSGLYIDRVSGTTELTIYYQ